MPLSAEQTEELRKVFGIFDVDHKGFIPSTELGVLIRSLGYTPSESEVRSAEMLVSKSQSGGAALTFEDVLKAVSSIADTTKPLTAADLEAALKDLDASTQGLLSRNELKHALTTLAEPLEEQQVDQLLAELPQRHDGMVDCNALAQLLAS